MEKTQLIIDIGINHNGDIKLAHTLIDKVAEVKADVVKFQLVNPDKVYKYDDPLYAIFKKTRLEDKYWPELKKHAEDKGLEFLVTPGDFESLDFLLKLDVKRIKIASDSAKNFVLVNYALARKPVILSTGHIGSFEEIKRYIRSVYQSVPSVILHCVSKYPTPLEEANLKVIDKLVREEENYGFKAGYSDHCKGYTAVILAVAKGAKVIEKHIKLGNDCPDSAVSLGVREIRFMIESIRKVETML